MLLPVLRQQVFYFVDRMHSNSLQHIAQPYKGINAMQLAGAKQRVQHSAALPHDCLQISNSFFL